MFQKALNYLLENWETVSGVLALVYELLISIFPTEKNKSIIDNAYKLIRFIIPNRSTKPSFIQKDGQVIKETKNHIIKMIVLFCLVSVSSFGQLNGRFKSIASYNADSSTVKTEVLGLQLMYGDIGALYYNHQHNPGKWRIFSDSIWSDLGSSSGSSFSLANGNGTTANTNKVDLGGTQTADVNIHSTNKNFTINTGSGETNLRASDSGTHFGHVQVGGTYAIMEAGTGTSGADNNTGISLSPDEINQTSFTPTSTSVVDLQGPQVHISSVASLSNGESDIDVSSTAGIQLYNENNTIDVSNKYYNQIEQYTDAPTHTTIADVQSGLSAVPSGTVGRNAITYAKTTNTAATAGISVNTVGISGTETSVTASTSGDITLLGNPLINTSRISNTSQSNVLGFNSSTGRVTYFTTPAATPAGSNKQIQFNNSGAFGASSKFIADASITSMQILAPIGAGANGVNTINNRYVLITDENNTNQVKLQITDLTATVPFIIAGSSLTLNTGILGDININPLGNLKISGLTLSNTNDYVLSYDGSSVAQYMASTAILKNSATLDFPSTLAQTDSDLTVTVTGAALGDGCTIGAPNGSMLSGAIYSCWVSASNTVSVRFSVYGATPKDPASGTFNVFVFKQ